MRAFSSFCFASKKKLTREKLGFKFTVGTDAKIGNFAALICFSFNFFLFFSHIPSNIRESRSSHLTNTETFLFRSLACHFFLFCECEIHADTHTRMHSSYLQQTQPPPPSQRKKNKTHAKECARCQTFCFA